MVGGRHKESIMEEKIRRDSWLIMPDNSIQIAWSIFMSLVLVWSCAITPLQLAVIDGDGGLGTFWTVVNGVVDILFLIDLILTFNTAIYDKNFEIIYNRKTIVWNYLTGWFIIDLVAIIPF